MDLVLNWLAANPIMLLFLLVGVGSVVGNIRVGGVALGAAAVLFVSIAVSALGATRGISMEITPGFGTMGLALFTFAVGISSGPVFANGLRTQGRAMLSVVVAVVLAGAAALVTGPLLGLTIPESAGTFAGAVTNTAAMAAAGGTPDVTVGYSLAYVFGVLGILLIQQFALRKGVDPSEAPPEIVFKDVLLERIDPELTVRDLEKAHGDAITLSRVLPAGSTDVELATADRVLGVGDTVTVVGDAAVLTHAIAQFGTVTNSLLMQDRGVLDFRRITVSNPALVGRSLGELGLESRFGATASLVRRADLDMVAHPALVLQPGDRVRVVAPRDQMGEVGKYFGDSSRGMTTLNAVWLGLGVAAGFAIGLIPFPLPGGGTFVFGSALGCLLVGLLLGHIGRIGPVMTTLPLTVTTVLTDLGLLLFLAQVGSRSGGQILGAVASGKWLSMLTLGVVVTMTLGISAYVMGKVVLRMEITTLVGFLAGTQTQPANLAFADSRTGHDFRVSAAYSLAYPVGMLAKILTAAVLALLA